MRSKNWYAKFALAFAAISRLGAVAAAQTPPAQAPPAKTPILALLDPADAEHWRAWSAGRGFRIVTTAASAKPIDGRVLDLQAAVQAALKDAMADSSRVYLVGRRCGIGCLLHWGAPA